MVELWQSYGSWFIYGIFFIVMVLLHGRMHGGHGGHCGHQAEHHGADAADGNAASGQARDDPGKRPHSHRGGCC